MFTDKFLRDRRGVELDVQERAVLEKAIFEIRTIDARKTVVQAGETLSVSMLLLEGFMCRYLDDREGMRQLVAVQVPGDFLDLHAYPLKILDHDVASLTAATIAVIPHKALDEINAAMPELTRKLWFSTLLDAAMHRAWLFRLGRLDAVGRVAHFLSETNVRLVSAGLSDGTRFALGITQADISEICGITSVHANRVLRQLREDRLCIFRSSLVEILDVEGLARRGQFNPAYLYIESKSGRPDIERPTS
ncbi:MAG: Crp/Fnr family transcriptional regulator [Sphingopyxis sp.]|uniref:Crp/Fnr family transcriptional regulator n=1 Tax=Sphingobium sp. TaxID=1912891 RepID=UPI001A1D2325|nr:Crp/Fnr family transcriptional regulator [Sphingobium sp.]MBJ7441994.1 Crp/Fnr family transcriptional regulator [Sphingopyxis sp.]